MKRMNLIAKQKGLAAVEMLIAAPVLILLLMAIIEFGNAFVSYTTLNKMVQNGIRHATTDIAGSASYDQIANVDEIKNIVVYGHTVVADGSKPMLEDVSTSDVVVTHSNGYVTVTVNHNYTPITNSFHKYFDMTLPINSSATMRTAP